MQIQLPLDTWIVVEGDSTESVFLISKHESQCDAEAERDRRNQEARCARYRACIILEPVAERMGGQPCPTRQI
jgi:hypothetical protein